MKVRRVLAAYASDAVRVAHNVTIPRGGDLDHVVRAGGHIVAIETKAERPSDSHLAQARREVSHARRVLFEGSYVQSVVVHPNSDEPVTYDRSSDVWRCGLPSLTSLLDELLAT